MSHRYRVGLIAVLAAVIGVAGLAGCQPAGKFSDKEMQQLKEGPPAEMPAEARKAMEDMRSGTNRPTPPRPKGQPGPGAPIGG